MELKNRILFLIVSFILINFVLFVFIYNKSSFDSTLKNCEKDLSNITSILAKLDSNINQNEELYKKNLVEFLKNSIEDPRASYILLNPENENIAYIYKNDYGINNKDLDNIIKDIVKNKDNSYFYSSSKNIDYFIINRTFLHYKKNMTIIHLIEKKYLSNRSPLNLYLAFIFIILLIIIFLSIESIFKKFDSINEEIFDALKKIYDGNIDFEIEKIDGEFSELTMNLNKIIARFREIIYKVKDFSLSRLDIKLNLRELISDNNIKFNDTYDNIKNSYSLTKNISLSYSDTNMIIGDLKDNISSLYYNINKNIEGNKVLSKDIKNSDEKIKNLVEEIKIWQSVWNSLKENITESNDLFDSFITNVVEINRKADEISRALNLINTITAKTSMLAMNAAIQAAHAGEYGKGFSVVAGEIQKLAEASQERTKNIFQIVSDLEKYVSKVNEDSKVSGIINENIIKKNHDIEYSKDVIKNIVNEISTINISLDKSIETNENNTDDFSFKINSISDSIINLKDKLDSFKDDIDQLNSNSIKSNEMSNDLLNNQNSIKDKVKDFSSYEEIMEYLSEFFINIKDDFDQIKEKIEQENQRIKELELQEQKIKEERDLKNKEEELEEQQLNNNQNMQKSQIQDDFDSSEGEIILF